ncbi:MAG: helix-turn-helix transcriptional regulator [Lachnospiraceae bacterium]|nr:helix-turn-helix transcriptional regulator [Lachnospiraceae bacterium]
MTGIGENIKKLRKAKGLTQDELAEVIGISGQAVSKWENGGSPDLEMLTGLISLLNKSCRPSSIEYVKFSQASYSGSQQYFSPPSYPKSVW